MIGRLVRLVLALMVAAAAVARAGDSPTGGPLIAYHWRVEGTVHGLAFTGEASVHDTGSTWHMDLDLVEHQHLTITGTWVYGDRGRLVFHTSYADASVVFEPVPGILNNLPGSFGAHRWQQVSSTVDLHFTQIEPW